MGLSLDNLTQFLTAALSRAALERHVTVLDGEGCPIAPSDPAAIVSGLPYVRVRGGRAVPGRRRRLTVGHGQRQSTLAARCGPLSDEPTAGWLAVQHGRDRLGRRVPLCAVDGTTATIHWLVDLETAEVLAAPANTDPAQPLAETLIEQPLAALLQQAPAPHVGAEVHRQVRALIEQRPVEQRHALESEKSLLQNLIAARGLPGTLVRRCEMLTRLLERPSRSVEESRVELEVARLVKLVASRALAALRFGRDRIEGLINPGGPGGDLWLCALMFRLQLGCGPMHPILQTWSPTQAAPGRGQAHCLGEAHPVLTSYDEDGDLYGLVDTVINYRETNHIRRTTIVPGPATSHPVLGDGLGR